MPRMPSPAKSSDVGAAPKSPGGRSLRGRRIPAEDFELGEISFKASHLDAELAGTVENLSALGLQLRIDEGNGHRGFFLGDRLEGLEISAAQRIVYCGGDATVCRADTRGDAVEVGVQIHPVLHLAELYQAAFQASAEQRWEAARSDAEALNVRPEFAAWTARLSWYLETLTSFLQAEQERLRWEARATREALMKELWDAVKPGVIDRLYKARNQLGRIVASFTDDEHATHRAFCQRELARYFLQSPFVERALSKPLGYAGDFELMNMLYRDHREGDSLLGQLINVYCLGEVAATANISRVDYLVSKLYQAMRSHPPDAPMRIANIGSGPAKEIERFLADVDAGAAAHVDILLLNQELKAIEYCERGLSDAVAHSGARVHCVRESIRRLVVRGKLTPQLGECHLIYSAGLFDYLGDRAFRSMLSVLYESLAPGGTMVIGNVSAENPSRWMQEYFADWFLTYRTAERLFELSSDLKPEPAHVTVESEDTGFNLFLVLARQS